MYGIPKDLKIDDIIGQQIYQIRIGKYDIQFMFSSGEKDIITTLESKNKRFICLQGDLKIFNKEACICVWDEKEGFSNTRFREILNLDIVSYQLIDEKQMKIDFVNEYSIILIDSSDQYESMQIYPEGIII